MLSNEMARVLRKYYKQYNITPPKFNVGQRVWLKTGEYGTVTHFDYKGNAVVELWGGESRVVKQDDCTEAN